MISYDAVEIFRALGDPVRFRIFQMLLENPVVHCTDLEQELQIGKSTISYHIKTLRSAGLINVHKDGRFYHYTLRRAAIDEYMPDLLKALAQLPRQELITAALPTAVTE